MFKVAAVALFISLAVISARAKDDDPSLFKQPCEDTDGGIKPMVRGATRASIADGACFKNAKGNEQCTTSFVVDPDHCRDKTTLIEYYCEKGRSKSTAIRCPKGCADGACLP